jgi:hypothetical protein
MAEPKLVIYDVAIGIVSSLLSLLITQNIILAFGLFISMGFAGFLLHFVIRYWRIRSRGGIVDVFKDQKSCKKLIYKRMIASHRVMILAVQAFHIIRPLEGPFYKAMLKRKGKTGASVRLLLLNPEAHDYVRTRAKEIGEKEDDFVKFIKDSFDVARRLREEESIDIQIKFYSALPIWQLFVFDDCLFVSFYTSGAERHSLPHYQVAGDSPLFESFVRFFNQLWENSLLYSEIRPGPV